MLTECGYIYYVCTFDFEYLASLLVFPLSFTPHPPALSHLPPDAAEESKAEDAVPADAAAADATESKDE